MTGLSAVRRRWVAGCLVGCALAQGACLAQAPEPDQTAETYRIAGRVVSEADGHALPRATVEILSTKSRAVLATTISGDDGSFAFPAVKAGGYVLQGQARGYIASAYQHHGVYSTAIITGAGVDTESLVLRLTADAELSGQILDETGEPVRNASVVLYYENHLSGAMRIERMRTAQTDDRGRYEIARLQPGRYYVSAVGVPWYAVHPQRANQQNTFSNIGIVDLVDENLDVAYAETFYPGVTDAEAAEAIVLKAGASAEIDLRLTPQQAVTVVIPRVPGEKNVNFQGLQTMVFGQPEQVMTQMQASQTEMAFVGVPAGRYVLKETSQEPGGGTRSFEIDARGRSVAVETSRAESLGSVKVSVRSADGGKLPAQMQFVLQPRDGTRPTLFGLNQKSEAQVNDLKPGEYEVARNAAGGAYFIAEVTLAGKPAPNRLVHVAGGAVASVGVVVAQAATSVEGVAQRDGRGAPGAMVLLVAATERVSADSFWRDQSDLDGSFRMAGVPPGRYVLLAIEDGWDVEWRRPEVLAKYLAGGVPVVVGEGARGVMRVATAVVAQPR